MLRKMEELVPPLILAAVSTAVFRLCVVSSDEMDQCALLVRYLYGNIDYFEAWELVSSYVRMCSYVKILLLG